VATTPPTSAASPPVGASTSPASTPPAAAKTDGAFVVQLAAFADDKGANALANKLKRNGYAAYVEPINTSRGTLWRVRVGGYGTRPEADAARVALKGEGYSGIIATSQ
jgi:DedD protein